MRGFLSIFKREIRAYFSTPLAYVFLVIFLIFSTYLFFQNDFFHRAHASMGVFFANMPLLFTFLVPAIAMRLWAEERRSNSIELLFSLPITVTQAVLGKFAAAWMVLALALALTFPAAITIFTLGNPDPGPIWTGYVASILLAGAYLAVGSFFSALSRNQVVAFVLAVVACAVLLYAGRPTALASISDLLGERAAAVARHLSFQIRFDSLLRGVIEWRDILFFVLAPLGALWANIIVLKERMAAG
jgi:gliding motility-associated transport system permease protein